MPEIQTISPNPNSNSVKVELSKEDGAIDPKKKKAKITGSPPGDVRERASLHQFHTKVTDAPNRADSLKFSMIKDSSKEVARTVSTSAPDYSGKHL